MILVGMAGDQTVNIDQQQEGKGQMVSAYGDITIPSKGKEDLVVQLRLQEDGMSNW